MAGIVSEIPVLRAYRAFQLVTVLTLAPLPIAAQSNGVDGTGVEDAAFPVDVESAPRPEARTTRTQGPIVVDGIPEEPAWVEAEAITGFIQSSPRTGWPATEATVVRVLYDEDYLYISAVCYESDISGIIVPSLEQDYETHDSDMFGVTIDTYLDRRNAFMFLVNPGGALKDGQVFDNSRNYNIPWEGVMELRTQVLDSAWTVEMAIPFTTLRFDPSAGEQSWGFQFSRRVRRKNEESYWAPLDRRELIHKMSRAGTVTGFRGLRPGRNVSLKPYVAASRASGSLETAGAGESGLDGGLDLKWGITPRLTLDGTLRTDFSQVEVDQERVNLTRFSLFFPEKRDFFLENSGIFDFGDVTERGYRMGASLGDFTLFHSRRIGLTRTGQPLPILGGGRVSGSVGEFEVGLLNMQTRTNDLAPQENFTVARLKRKILGTSDVGVMFLNRMSTEGSDEYNRSYGADANIRFLDNLVVHSYLVRTDAPGEESDGTAARISAAYRDALWDISAFYKTVGEGFDPGVGFIRRRGMRHTYATLGAHPQPSWRLIQEVNPYAEIDYITNRSSRLDTRRVAGGFGVEFMDGSRLTLERAHRFERILEPFQVASEVTVPVGTYDFAETSVDLRTSRARDAAGTVSLTVGDFFDGTLRSMAVGAFLRPSYHMTLELSGERNVIDLPNQSTTADVLAARVNYAASTRFYTNAFVQYNASTRQMVTNLRLDFLHAPLSDVFLVYTERRDLDSSAVLERIFSAKVTRMVSF